MKWIKTGGKWIRKFAWAFVVAYMIAWHNVYKEKADMVNTVEYHMENDHTEENSSDLI
jgi:hypothetical protein